MGIAGLFLTLGAALFGVSSVSGHVLDSVGNPMAGARVFLEPGVAAGVQETASGADGAFAFGDVPLETAGVFALAPGFGFGGTTAKIASNTELKDLKITLLPAAKLSGKVTDGRGHAVKGARITRVALVGESKVGIPLAKLKALGIDEPATDDKGRFVVENLPQGVPVALKVGHPDYAQEAVDNINPAAGDVEVKLTEGIVLEGDVLARGTQTAVSGVLVMVRNAQPPHDTAVADTDASGAFAIRLKPGAYMCQAVGAGMRSPGWEKVTLNTNPAPRIKVYTAAMGAIEGKVCDAVTGNAVAGAKIQIETEGNLAATVRTGSTGEYSVSAMAGANQVKLYPAPGYIAPEQPPLQFQVEEGKATKLPTFWLAPIPTYTVLIVDGNDQPVAGALLTVLSPPQFGWQTTGADGKAPLTFAAWPAGGVVGLVEHPSKPSGALFTLKKEGQKDMAKVQLFPLASVKGRVVSPDGKPVEGAVVASVVGGEGIPLWRTVSGSDGRFRWDSVVAQVRQQCIASPNGQQASEPVTFSLEAGAERDLGDIAVPVAAGKDSLLGKTLAWRKNKLIGGDNTPLRPPQGGNGKEPPQGGNKDGFPQGGSNELGNAVVIYCGAADAAMVVDALGAVGKTSLAPGLRVAVVVDGAYEAKGAPISVYAGKAPGPASTYVMDAKGKVLVETFGMPPIRVFQK